MNRKAFERKIEALNALRAVADPLQYEPACCGVSDTGAGLRSRCALGLSLSHLDEVQILTYLH